jgi:hypothetical protein
LLLHTTISDEVPKKRKAQNRAAQKAFRERQKRAYRDLEVKNEELNASMGEALQEINRLRSLVDNMSLEMKAYKDTTLTAQETTEPAVCSIKCRSRVLSPRAVTSSPQRLFDRGKSARSFEHVMNAPNLHLHNNACLFKITATSSDQQTAEFSSASNEAVATMQSAKQMCVTSGVSLNHSIPNYEPDRNCQASQAHISESFPWLLMDATLSTDQVDASTGLGSHSRASLYETESSCSNLMNCPSYSSLQREYGCGNTGSSNFASTPPIDNDTLDTPLTSSDATSNMLQFCKDAPQFHSRSTDANHISRRSSAPFQAAPVAFSDLTIPSSFGLGELDWFEALY